MASAYPVGPRFLAGACALLVGVYFAILSPLAFVKMGYPGTAAWLAVSSAVYVAFLALVAAAPGATQRTLLRRTRADLRDPGHVVALILLAGAIFFVFGNGLANGIYALEGTLRHIPQPGEAMDASTVILSVIVNLAVFVLPVILYLSFVGQTGPAGAFRALGLSTEDAPRQLLAGLLVAAGFIAALVAVSAILTRFVSIPDNQRALDIAKGLDVASALAVAAGAAVSEEIFFRGFLLARIGVIPQAILFSLAHLSYVNVLETVVTLALGLGLGYMRRRTGSLWGPVAAHFAFDFLELLVAIYLPSSP